MDKPIRETPWRSPMAVSEALQDIIEGKTICELGCAEGDNLMFMSRYAVRVFGMELDPKRYSVAQKRGYEVVVGNYFENDIPDADVYYFWPDDGPNDNEKLVDRILKTKPSFKGHIIVGGDPQVAGEEESVRRVAKLGEIREVPYNEGDGWRQSGTYLVAVIDVGALRSRQELVLLLSAPRCGSSCATACLSLCGLNVGTSCTTHSDQWNTKGYFENQQVLRFNQEALNFLKLDIAQPTLLTREQVEKLCEQFQQQLENLITTQFFPDKTSLIKDPRIVTLWPLYKRALSALNIGVKIIVLHRSADSCAKSMVAFPAINTTYEKGTAMHQCYYELISGITKEVESTDMSFERLVANPAGEVQRVCDFLGLTFTDEQKTSILAFVERGLVNFG